ncbi:hypothetical protein DLP05_083 [Stenotrophomonas phage vB_SmaS_DLP_5]|uniref:Uncharacterized protein n=1 Tax=Stenotrophomonas phage vB_SmaS_DLP_5 TaxID=2044561 RepID=A0A2D2W2V0_9CAUD|nr:hypothetical protein FDJ07_gp138 [Stenotrophomonas phage vB_SmaS_DLP_5]ATS92370.1 hypothetical protein DLP05_083 [Stenotrophomonas phage vB_SmaS_DLP_5]
MDFVQSEDRRKEFAAVSNAGRVSVRNGSTGEWLGYEFDVWMEGYQASGDSGTAMYMGRARGKDFQTACAKALYNKGCVMSLYNPRLGTYWGCRLYDNEQDARKSFG